MKNIFNLLILVGLCLSVCAQTNDRSVMVKPNTPGAEKRLALVIGNSGYQFTDKLKNPVNDANDITAALRAVGFEVISGTDLSLAQMRRLVREFGVKLQQQKGVGLFYYAGHGVQVGGRNYLVPIDANIETETETPDYSLDSDLVLRFMRDAGNEFNIVILDACRNNPFAGNWRNFSASRSLGEDQGLARITPPSGTIILYSTEPGKIASDGTGRNGLFTQSLLANINKPNIEFDALVKLIARDVKTNSSGLQSPWKEGLYDGDFYFSRNSSSSTAQPALNVSTQTGDAPSSNSSKYNIPTSNVLNNKIPSSKYKVGDTLKNSLEIEFTWIPLGEFMMGSTESEIDEALYEAKKANKNSLRGWFAIEAPKHKVNITRGFWMGKYEVTQKQWEMIMGNNPSDYRDCGGNNCPVEQVSWYDVQVFLTRLNAKDPRFTYRLPTEAEWEYACRAGTTTAFAFGDSLSSKQASFDGRFPWGNAEKSEFNKKTRPIGSFQPNAWGLYDMHGNVWEWVQDWDGNYAAGEAIDPTGPETGANRVIRGGEWVNIPSMLRSAARSFIKPDFREANGIGSPLKRINIGFRIIAIEK